VVASIFVFKEPITKIIAIALGLTFFGIILTLNIFTATLGQISFIGVLLALGAAVGAAAYAITIKGITTKYSSFTITFYSFLCSAVGYTIMLCFQPPQSLPTATEALQISSTIVPYILAFIFYARGLRFLTPGQVGIAASTEPGFGLILAAVFLGEILTVSQILGSIAIIAAVVLLQIFPSTAKTAKN
ncbi:MAG: DMT family transporter, partial [Clostridiales bacterium]